MKQKWILPGVAEKRSFMRRSWSCCSKVSREGSRSTISSGGMGEVGVDWRFGEIGLDLVVGEDAPDGSISAASCFFCRGYS